MSIARRVTHAPWVQGTAFTDGNIPDVAVQAQVATLNAAFNPSGFAFRLASVDRTTNATWFMGINSGTRAEADAANLLKQVLCAAETTTQL